MPYAILRFQKRKAGSVAACERHNERKKEAYKSNPDIDMERSRENYHLVAPPRYTYKKEINRMTEAAGCRVRRDSVMLVETLITASPEFMHSLSPAEQRAYFAAALDFISERVGKQNIISAVVHMDETTPHMHLCFVPITKDLSRLGHDHLKVGHFTEIYFPMKNVRYIAVNDCVDTANKNNDIAALKNVMNEFYSRDNSRKIRSSIRARAKAGLYRCSYASLGYRKAPDNHNKLIADEETAWIVKRIFEYANAGMGSHKIASTLRKEQVPCPSW